MKFVRQLVTIVIVFLVTACDVNVKDVQLIEISALNDVEKNDEVAKSLMFYAPSYFIHNIKSLNKENYAGIQTGYVRPSNTNKSNFRVFYEMNKGVLEKGDVEKLKAEFESFIPILASDHASKIDVFESESKKKQDWFERLLVSNGQEQFKQFSPKLIEKEGLDVVEKLAVNIKEQLGTPEKISFIKGQYYKAYGSYQEQVILYYEVLFSKGIRAVVNIAIDEKDELKRVINIDLKQIMT